MIKKISGLRYLILLFVISCTTTIPDYYLKRSEAPKEAVLFFQQLEKQLTKEKVSNAIGNKVKGFPYLRTNRFFSFLKYNLSSIEEKQQWVKYLKNYDKKARQSEIQNLSQASINQLFTLVNLPLDTPREKLFENINKYGNQLLAYDQQKPDFYETLISLVESPDDYSTAMRVFGLYPLAYGPVALFTGQAYDRMEEWHKLNVDQLNVTGELIQYQPDLQSSINIKTIQNIFSTTKKGRLGLFQFSQADLSKILNFFAPVYIQDTTGIQDKPGKLIWDNETLVVDHQTPAVYYYFSYMLLEKKPVFQVNYVNWFSAREGPIVPWIEEGFLDGFNFRVTLGSKGEVIMTDIVHNCGCYHFFIPREALIKRIIPASFEFDALTPTYLPDTFPEQRLTIRTNSGWHQIENIGLDNETMVAKKYQLIPYNLLESLPVNANKHKSIFDMEGIVSGSERVEPYLLFPMGIPEIGAMRQRTHQPTKLIGREHFDNPLLLDNNFEFNK